MSLLVFVVAGLIGLGLLAGLAVEGRGDRSDAAAAERATARQADALDRVQRQLHATEEQMRRVGRRARAQRRRIDRLRQRVRRLERDNRELRRALTALQQE